MTARSRGSILALAAAVIVGFATIARAGPVLDRVKAGGVIRCGAVARPGLLTPSPDGAPTGLLVDLCRAIGVAAAGASVETSVSVYDSDRAFDAVRQGRDDVFFLSGAEIVDQKLAGFLVPGPPVFHETTALMVAGDSTCRASVRSGGALDLFPPRRCLPSPSRSVFRRPAARVPAYGLSGGRRTPRRFRRPAMPGMGGRSHDTRRGPAAKAEKHCAAVAFSPNRWRAFRSSRRPARATARGRRSCSGRSRR